MRETVVGSTQIGLFVYAKQCNKIVESNWPVALFLSALLLQRYFSLKSLVDCQSSLICGGVGGWIHLEILWIECKCK